MAFDQGSPTFGINDAKVIAWTAAGASGAGVDIMAIQMASVSLQVISAIANGDDQVVAAAARLTGAQLTMRFVGLNPAALAIMTGVAATVSTTTSQIMFEGGERMPYFSAMFKALAEEGGDTWVFLPKLKIMSDFTPFQGEYGAFSTPELTVQAVPDAKWGVANFITHPTDVAMGNFPPANISSIS